ncbi:MAG: SAF domain-containing protein [Chloroflexaceae bacterium]
MTTLTPTSAPLSQALARKRGNPLPAVLLGFGLIIAVTFAILGYLESQKTETLVVLARDVPYGQQLTAEDISLIQLPLHRPAQLAGISDPAAVVGRYAARDLGANDLVQAPMLLAEPPAQPVYPNGQALSPDMVPLPFSTATIGPLSHRDRVNIGFNDRSGAPDLCDRARRSAEGDTPSLVPSIGGNAQPRPYACRLLSSVRVLYVDEAAGVAYLELTPYQAHTIWALQAAGLELWGERYGSTSAPLNTLDRLDIGQVSAERLDAPAAADPEAMVTLPGARSPVPGSPQP